MNGVNCVNCGIEYAHRIWFSAKPMCIFCDNYMPMRNTREEMLIKLNWHYAFSGAIDRQLYIKEYIQYLNKWCAKWYIPLTAAEQVRIDELLKEKNWTREYWH